MVAGPLGFNVARRVMNFPDRHKQPASLMTAKAGVLTAILAGSGLLFHFT